MDIGAWWATQSMGPQSQIRLSDFTKGGLTLLHRKAHVHPAPSKPGGGPRVGTELSYLTGDSE